MTRERILQAALQVFGELGYEATTFQAIAMRADLTRPAIHHYFGNKRVLYGELVERVNTAMAVECMTRAGAETSLIGSLSAFFAAVMQVDAEDRWGTAFLATSLLEAERHPELARHENSSLDAARAFVRWTLEEAVVTGEIAIEHDLSALVEMLVAVMWGMAFYAGFLGERDQSATVLETLEAALTRQLWTLQG